MMPRWLPLAWFAAMALFVSALPAAADAARPTLTPGGVSPFGQSAFVLTLPRGEPIPADGALTENGEQVPDVSVTPASAVPGSYGVVLLLDASSGRAGKAIQGQLAAARKFLEHRPDGLPVALVTYNAQATVAVPFTTKPGALDDALKQPPPLARGVEVVDATAAALDLFAAEKLGGGAIVALAGEPDTGSRQLPAAVAKRALRAGVWVFGASLSEGRPAAATIDALTPDGVGQNLGEMSGPGLVALFDALGKQTAGASVLSYTSAAKPGSKVAVEFQGGERQVRTLAVLPQPVAAPAPDPEPTGLAAARERLEAFVVTDAGRMAVSVAVVLLLFLGVAPFVMEVRRRAQLRSRVSSYAGELGGVLGLDAQGAPITADGPEDRSLLAGDRMRRLQGTLELARMEITAGRLVLVTLTAAVVLGYLVAALSGIPLAGIAVLIGTPFVSRVVVLGRLGQQRRLFADQLADSLQAAAAAMRGGHSFAGALASLADEAPDPAATEFRRVVAAERIGIPLETAFAEMIQRMDNRDLQQVALVAILQRETGGNAAEALDRVVENIRGRDDVRRLVRTLTAQGQASRWVLTGIPIGIGVLLTTINGEYMAPLWETPLGRVMLGIAGFLCLMGSLAIKKIVDIEV